MLGARVRHSACGKGHEEGGSTYAKAGSGLRSPPGTSTSQVRVLMVELFVKQLNTKGLIVHLLSDLVISSFCIFLRQVKKI